MKQLLLNNKKALPGLLAMLLVAGLIMSFQDSPYMNKVLNEPARQSDTIPSKKPDGSMTMKEFDALMLGLDKTLLQVGQELKKMDLAIIQQQVEKSLTSVDLEKIMQQVEQSLKNIDVDKLVAQASKSINDINWDKTNAEMKLALEDAKKEMEQARVEMSKIDKAALKKDLEQAGKDIEKAKLEIKKIDMDKIMADAKNEIDKAKIELKETKQLFIELEKDGLVNSKDGFTIEYKNKDLYINGHKQNEKVTDKYRKYFKGEHFKISIDKEK